jgi:hypothetical protein
MMVLKVVQRVDLAMNQLHYGLDFQRNPKNKVKSSHCYLSLLIQVPQ